MYVCICMNGFALLVNPNKGETAIHGCYCQCDMAVRMREVLARPSSGLVFVSPLL